MKELFRGTFLVPRYKEKPGTTRYPRVKEGIDRVEVVVEIDTNEFRGMAWRASITKKQQTKSGPVVVRIVARREESTF